MDFFSRNPRSSVLGAFLPNNPVPGVEDPRERPICNAIFTDIVDKLTLDAPKKLSVWIAAAGVVHAAVLIANGQANVTEQALRKSHDFKDQIRHLDQALEQVGIKDRTKRLTVEEQIAALISTSLQVAIAKSPQPKAEAAAVIVTADQIKKGVEAAHTASKTHFLDAGQHEKFDGLLRRLAQANAEILGASPEGRDSYMDRLVSEKANLLMFLDALNPTQAHINQQKLRAVMTAMNTAMGKLR